MDKNATSYKINLHIIEACNYSCGHCFAKFHSTCTLSIESWKTVVDNCLASINVSGFNIAGGEPLLYKDLSPLVQYIKSKGCECSIITNGSLITDKWIMEQAKDFNTIGISVDSFNPTTLLHMGRVDNQGKYVSKDRLQAVCRLIKECNPSCKIKINSVISQLNKTENLFTEIKQLHIDKWKVIKIRPFKDDKCNNLDLVVSHDEFVKFVSKNLNIALPDATNQSHVYQIDRQKVVIEEDVEGGYIIVDSNGCLIDNTKQLGHVIVRDLKTQILNHDLTICNFNKELYNSRYIN